MNIICVVTQLTPHFGSNAPNQVEKRVLENGVFIVNLKAVGINLSNNVFQVCVLLNGGSIAWDRKITRTR